MPLTIVNNATGFYSAGVQLGNGKPVMMRVEVRDYGISHMVLLCGLDQDASYLELIIMDPDYASNYIYISLPSNAYGDASYFSYTNPDGGTFNLWSGTYY